MIIISPLPTHMSLKNLKIFTCTNWKQLHDIDKKTTLCLSSYPHANHKDSHTRYA